MRQPWLGLAGRQIEDHDLLADLGQREHSLDLGGPAHDQQPSSGSPAVISSVEDDMNA
ncbi:MAG TPA: hypothetical protein VIH92_00295 [Solirubrobacteraceae bacterium]